MNCKRGRTGGPKGNRRAIAAVAFGFLLAAANFAPIFAGAAPAYIPPSVITPDDVIDADRSNMISYPHFGTPVFVEPGRSFVAEVEAPAGFAAGGWSAWVETAYKRWDCAVGFVRYGANNIYLNMRDGYTVPVTVPSDVSPELCTLVLAHTSGAVYRSPASVSVVPVLDSSFYIMSTTDPHLGWESEGNSDGTNAPSAFKYMAAAARLSGARAFTETGDKTLYNLMTRVEGIKGMIVDTFLQGSEGMVPFVTASGNHEYDIWVYPEPSITTGTRLGEFDFDMCDRFFGMRAQVTEMGSFVLAKHDVSAYYGDTSLVAAMTEAWNSVKGAKYRLLMQHTHSGYTPLFNSQVPMPSPYPDVCIKGHDHQWKVNQTSPFYVLSLGGGGGGWTGGQGTMLNFNYDGNSWSAPQVNSSFGGANKMIFINYSGAEDEKARLRDAYSAPNNGTATSNTATVTNQVDFNFYDGRLRFVMAKGNYSVTGGDMLSHYDSADGGKTIVLVRVNIPAGSVNSPSTTAVSIAPGAAPTPTPYIEPEPTPASTAVPRALNLISPKVDPTFENDWVSAPYCSNTTISRVTSAETAPYAGNYSMKVTQTAANGQVYMYPNRPIVPGRTYRYSVWLKAGANLGANVPFRLRLGWQQPAAGSIDRTITLPADGEWHEFAGNIDAGEAEGSGTYFMLTANAATAGTFYVDNAYFADISTPAVIGSYPAHQSTATREISSMRVEFNHEMLPETLTAPGSIKINNSTALISSIVPDDTMGGATINFVEALPPGEYAVSFSGVADIFGLALSAPAIEFETVKAVDGISVRKPVIMLNDNITETLPAKDRVYTKAGMMATATLLSTPDRIMTIFVYKGEPEPENTIYINAARTNAQGSADFSFPVGDEVGGAYTIAIGGEGVSATAKITVENGAQTGIEYLSDPVGTKPFEIGDLKINGPWNSNVSLWLSYTNESGRDKAALAAVAQYSGDDKLICVDLTSLTFLAEQRNAALMPIDVPINEKTEYIRIMAVESFGTLKPITDSTVYVRGAK